MVVGIQVVSAHPVLVRTVERILSHVRDFRTLTLLPALTEAEAARQQASPRLFLLDACSLRADLGPLAERCRSKSPSRKFLALLPPGNGSYADELRLFYWGIDGFVELHKSWQTELPQAIRSILQGQFWVPPDVMLAFAKQSKALLDVQLLPGHCLTARECPVLQLLMRRSTNKEISNTLNISERTAKFHVSNILIKLQLENSHSLAFDELKPKLRTSFP